MTVDVLNLHFGADVLSGQYPMSHANSIMHMRWLWQSPQALTMQQARSKATVGVHSKRHAAPWQQLHKVSTRCCAWSGDEAVLHLEQQLAGLMSGPGTRPQAAAAGVQPQGTLSAAMQRRIHHNIQVRINMTSMRGQIASTALTASEHNVKLRC